MKRNNIVESLMKEGFTEKTLVKFSDKQLSDLYERIIGESDVMISKKDPEGQKKLIDAKKENKSIEFYEEKPSAGVSKESINYNNLEDYSTSNLESLLDTKEKEQKKLKKIHKEKPLPFHVGNIRKLGTEILKIQGELNSRKSKKEEKNEIKEWVKRLANENFHTFTSKNEIMEIINVKLMEQQPSTTPGRPDTDTPVRERPTTRPGKPKRENPFEPKHKPKPKASSDDKLPEFLKFDNLGIKFKNEK